MKPPIGQSTRGILLAIGLAAILPVAGCSGNAESRPAMPSIRAQPASQTVAVGQTATFTVLAAGTAPLTYQWQRNGSDISGANSSSYTTPPATIADNGSSFSVTVADSTGNVTSNPAMLTVAAAAPTITSQPQNQTVGAGQTGTFSVTAAGAAPLSYQWRKNGSNISGANSSSYTTPATTGADNGSAFDVIVSNSAGTVTSNPATLTVTGTAPAITSQPQGQTVVAGQKATFSVTATGTAPLSYQWQVNGSNISGANQSSFTTAPTTSTDNGSTFDVIVSNPVGSVTSSTATLTVNSPVSGLSFAGGFTSSGLTFNGSAALSGSHLRLTDGAANEAGSAFFNTPVDVGSFITDFTFQLTNATAEGFTFTLQTNNPAALGAAGQSLGYGSSGAGTGGITNSIAIGFQLYDDATGAQVSRTGMWTGGASPGPSPGTDTTPAGVNLHSGHAMAVHVAYDGNTLRWTITDTSTQATFGISFPVNIPGLVGDSAAYAGFTGGTGANTAVQDVLNWTYNAVPVTAFQWPVDTPVTYAASSCGGPNDYATYCSQTPILGQYHTGIDVCPQTVGCAVGNPVYATSAGVVETAVVVSDAAGTLCDGSSDAAYQVNSDTSNLGNALIIAHPNGEFSLYGHLDCIWPGIAPGVVVAPGTRIGNMGHSGFGQRARTFTPHTHFEMKDRGVLGDPTNKGYSGYTTDVPEGYGYHDPRIYLNPFIPTSISPVAIKVVASSAQNVLTGPDTSFASLTSIAPSQEFVASATAGSWYRIDIPNANGPVSGWVQGTSGSQTLVSVDSGATAFQVSGASSAGLDVEPGPASSPDLVAWDQTFSNCVPVARIWNGQWFVEIATQNGFDEFYMPVNYYFGSNATCKEPTGPGPGTGWVSSSFVK